MAYALNYAELAAEDAAYENVEYDEYVPQQDTGANVTYDEIRWWARWLDLFTASDLADAMGVSVEVGKRGVKALLWHGICEDTGDELDGPEGPETIIQYVPLPPGPREHLTLVPPERMVGYTEIVCPRGLPVRIRTDRDTRKNLSTPGTRHKMKMRELRYERMQEAIRKRAAEQKADAAKEPKWKRKRKGGAVIDTRTM